MRTIIPALNAGFTESVHRMVMENRPVDPDNIRGSHLSISYVGREDRK